MLCLVGQMKRGGVAAPGKQDATVRIGILGSGLMGGKLGTLLARAGHEVVFSYARSKEKLKRLSRNAGANARAGTPAEAVRHAHALLLAVRWSRLADVLQQAGDVSGKIIVSCSLPMNAGNTELVVAHTSSGACKDRPEGASRRRVQQRAQRGPFQRPRRAAQSQKAEPGVLWRRQARLGDRCYPDT
jgi:hypothetical protein